MATSSNTPPQTPPSRAAGAAVPAGTAAGRAAPAVRPAPKRRSKAAQTSGHSAAGADPARTATTPDPSGRPAAERVSGAERASDAERMSDAERQRRIAEAAYRKAEERGFAGDRQLEDWLEAEREHYQSASVDRDSGSR